MVEGLKKRGLASADRNNKATLFLTAPSRSILELITPLIMDFLLSPDLEEGREVDC